MKDTEESESRESIGDSGKAVWSPPTVKDLGDVVDQTLNNPGAGSDGGIAS